MAIHAIEGRREAVPLRAPVEQCLGVVGNDLHELFTCRRRPKFARPRPNPLREMKIANGDWQQSLSAHGIRCHGVHSPAKVSDPFLR